ncbi:MAG: hypothetical protein IBJ09_03765 [Bacteroidia bacterium]|nr:hypothetical protein [Bacteroidia bacterium]
MRSIAIILSVFFLALSAQARCSSRGLYTYPSEGELSANSLFLLEGYALSREVVRGLNAKFPVYLLSDKGEKVKLIVKEYNEGQFYLSQALLQPEKGLNMGETYTFCIDSLPPYEALGRYNASTGKNEKLRYTISKTADLEKPVLRSGPVFWKDEYAMFGCGPLSYVHFRMDVEDRSLLLVKATVQDMQSGKTSTFYLLSGGRELSLGHGMCSGSFAFEQGKEYEVQFAYMDASGNRLETPSGKIRFRGPVPGERGG